VAKEVGLLPLTRATHVLVIATGPISTDARKYAGQINALTAATVFLLDAGDFKALKASPTSLAQILRRQSEKILNEQPKESLWT
jgi:hypothetical protein